MPTGIMSKIGRALSVFGVSSPEDLAAQKRASASRKKARAEAGSPPVIPSEQPIIEETSS